MLCIHVWVTVLTCKLCVLRFCGPCRTLQLKKVANSFFAYKDMAETTGSSKKDYKWEAIIKAESTPIFKSLLSKYKNHRTMVRGHIVSNNWLRHSNLESIELGILEIIASYCNWLEFGWDNFHKAKAKTDEHRRVLHIFETDSGAQMITSHASFTTGYHIFKVKITKCPGGCSRSFGITTDNTIWGTDKEWNRQGAS